MNLPYDSRFVQKLAQRLREDILAKQGSFGAQFIREDAAATGLNCAKLIGEILGLETALKHIHEVDAEMNGKTKKD